MSAMKLLFVDDQSDIREVVSYALELDPAIEVRTCGSGLEAVSMAAAWRPDIILLDVMMPGMDGPTTLQRLRGAPETASIPVLFVTSRTQAAEAEHFLSLGAAGVIAKPFDPLTLAGSVRERLAGSIRAPAV